MIPGQLPGANSLEQLQCDMQHDSTRNHTEA